MKEKRRDSFGEEGDSGDKRLWNLLSHARKTEAGPMFVRNVLREVRLMDSAARNTGSTGVFSWLRSPALFVGGAAAAVLSILAVLPQLTPSDTSESSSAVIPGQSDPAPYPDPTEELVSIERLGELMEVTDPGTLSDEALMNLLF